MKLSTLLQPLVLARAGAAAAAAAPLVQAEYLFSNPPTVGGSSSSSGFKIPTSYESAVMARRILALTPLATFSTVFPAAADDGGSTGGGGGGSSDIAGVPIGLSDYVADCEGGGDPTILSLRIGTSFRNVRHGSNISVGLAWVPPYPPSRRIRSAPPPSSSSSRYSRVMSYLRSLFLSEDEQQRPDPAPYSAANLPRFSLLGYLEKIEGPADALASVAACYLDAHPDAKYWLPGNPIHEAEWVRLVVTKVYWIGGFGDRAYIGWIPADEWKGVTREEWQSIRLPGEKPGWKEWSMQEEFRDL